MVNTSGIAFSGLASGLDTQAIITQLVALERLPIQQIEGDRAIAQRKIDRLGQFQNLVTQLSDKAEEFSSMQGFLALAIQGVDESVATISAGEGAFQGSHSMEVQRLASVDRWAFDGVGASDSDLALVDGQSVSFTVGSTAYDISVNAGESSLLDIADRINEAAGDDVNASVVNTGTESSPSYQLVLASKASGEDGRIINIASTIAGLNIDPATPDANGDPTSTNNVTVGNNAVALIDGLLIERSSNDFSDVLEGVSLEAVGLGTTEFGVEPDKERLKEQMEEFIGAYNDVIEFMKTENTFTPAPEDGAASTTGVLFGDSSLSAVRRELQTSLFNVPTATIIADTAGFSTLSNVGITQDRDGLLSLDGAKFDEKITQDLNALADMFVDRDGFERDPAALPNTPGYFADSTEDSGMFNTLIRNLERLSGNLDNDIPDVSLQGIFDLRKNTLEESVERMTGRIATKERALESYRQDLVLRYARLEELMGGLNAQGAALQSAIGQF